MITLRKMLTSLITGAAVMGLARNRKSLMKTKQMKKMRKQLNRIF